jgi:WD40 repeat protein
VGWCLASPDEAIIVTADQMPDVSNGDDLKALVTGSFVATISVWDARSGARKHLIRVPQAKAHPYYMYEWYARWMDDSRLLVVRICRENPVRAASKLKLIVIHPARGKVVKASGDFSFAGEHLVLSPDRKLALVKDDNYARRAKDGPGLEGMWRNIHARTHVFDLERLSLVSAWHEPRDATGEMGFALDARWRPDGKAVLTVGDEWCNGHPWPKLRLWDARRGRLLQTFSDHIDDVLDVAWTAAGDRLLSASEDGTARVWDTRTGKVRAVLRGHTAGLNRVVVLPGDRLAVTAAEEPVAKVWDLASGKLRFDLAGHDSAVREVEALPGKVVRTVTLRGTATTWDCSTGKRLHVTPKPAAFPKVFGVCQLVDRGGTLHMSVLKQGPAGRK